MCMFSEKRSNPCICVLPAATLLSVDPPQTDEFAVRADEALINRAADFAPGIAARKYLDLLSLA